MKLFLKTCKKKNWPCDQESSSYTEIFKVAFSTFWFKFGATLRRQAERRERNEAKGIQPSPTYI